MQLLLLLLFLCDCLLLHLLTRKMYERIVLKRWQRQQKKRTTWTKDVCIYVRTYVCVCVHVYNAAHVFICTTQRWVRAHRSVAIVYHNFFFVPINVVSLIVIGWQWTCNRWATAATLLMLLNLWFCCMRLAAAVRTANSRQADRQRVE